MAFEIDFYSDLGVEFERAYLRVNQYRCSSNDVVDFQVVVYVSKNRFLEGYSHISGSEKWYSFTADHSADAVNTKKQIYDYMETLDEYKDAKPVIEE